MRMLSSCGILLTVMKMVIYFCQAEYNNSENDLIRHVLMNNYNPLARPITSSSRSVYLNLSMGLKGLIQLDMKKQTLVSFGWLTVTWYDHFLRWDRNQYPFQEVQLKPNMVWRPDIVIFNTVSDLDQLEDQKKKVIVEHTGKVTWYAGGLFQTFCSIRIFLYPLDTQICTLDIVPWSSTNDYLKAAVRDPVFDDYVTMENHSEWRMVSKTAGYTLWPSNFWCVQFSFTLKRNVMFYIFNMILPIFMLSLMNCLVFLLPADSGEKMTVSVTMFLSFAVFLSVINNSLPPNSDSVCLFSVYVAVQMFVSVCSVIMAACIVFIHDKDKDSYVTPQSQSSNFNEDRMLLGVISKPCTSILPEAVQGPMTDSTTNNSSGSTLGFRNIDSPQARTSTDTVDSTRNEDGEGLVSVKKASASLSIKQIWYKFMRCHHLNFIERRLLTQQLDKICFKLSVSMNIAICLIFFFIWIFA